MSQTSRRAFLKTTAVGVGGTAPAVAAAWSQRAPNATVNVAVVGFRSRGRSHYRSFAQMPNVRVAALCDADERLFPGAVAEVEKLAGYRPDTLHDIRKLLERKDIDAISIATPDHWHALMTIWACQAGKDVYVEKPVSFTVVEGRRMVEAARKYRRIVQAGQNRRSSPRLRAAMRYLADGKLGKVYRAKIEVIKARASIGKVQESSIPPGVHWDLFLGPSPYRAYTTNRFHYGWHFFWDTSTTDVGNTGVHHLDVARWGLQKNVHPVKVHSTGGCYIWDSDQETPNVQIGSIEYADGSLIDFELNNLYSPPTRDSEVFYTSEGFLTSANDWSPVRGTFSPRQPDVSPAGISERASNASFPKSSYAAADPIEAVSEQQPDHFENFIACVRSRRVEDLYCDILEGHISAVLCHLSNISFRLGRKLVFDPEKETIVGDAEAARMLTRTYREPYVLPDKV